MSKFDYKIRGKLFLSAVLEKIDLKKQKTEEYVNIVVHESTFDPMPAPNIKRFWIVMTPYNFNPDQIDWIPLDLEKLPDLDNLIKNYSKDNKTRRVFISSVLKVPPIEIEPFYDGIACFCVPKSYLDSKIQFFLMFRDLSQEGKMRMLPNTFCGYT